MTITKERVAEFIKNPIDNGLTRGEQMELARMALSGMEAEPALYASEETLAYAKNGELHLRCLSQPMGDCIIPLHTAPQPLTTSERAELENYRNAQQVVPHFDKWFEDVIRPAMQVNGIKFAEQRMAYGTAMLSWNACCAAMLQGAENVESRCTIQTAPALDSSPKIAESRCTNSPVIPDGWVACSERMPEKADEVLCAKEFDGPGDWRQKVGYYLAGKWTVYSASWTPTHWQPLPAAPQREA